MNAKIREEGLNHSQVMDIAFNMTDVLGPRLTNSPGLKRAQEWAVSRLLSYGLVNAKRESWGQKFGKGWEVQKNYAAITVPYYHAIIAIPKAWTAGTNGPIRGEVVLVKADTITDLEKYKGKLAGKIVIMEAAGLAPERAIRADMARYSDGRLDTMNKEAFAPPRAFGGGAGAPGGRRGAAGGQGGNPAMMAAMRAQRMRPIIANFLKSQNVAVILSQGRGSDGTVFTTNGASYRDTAQIAGAELETSTEDYQRILRLVRAGHSVQMEADIKTQFFTDELEGYNVVAEIPGTDKKLKEQIVMVGGHYDSWHAGTGATDNAAGSAVMMEAVRILKAIGYKPKRTIRIALWSGEEQGLFGSRYYVANHFADRADMKLKPEHSKLSAYYNLDNGTGKIRGIYLQGDTATRPIFQAWLAPFKDIGAWAVNANNTGGTDHQSYDGVGLPGFQFIQDGMDYNTRTHHSNQDTYDRLVEADLKQAATIVASFVYHTSERKDMIPRKALPTPPPAQAAGGMGR
ncbi:M28 family metallopeptidase [Mucilaginibacter myungsuensis]